MEKTITIHVENNQKRIEVPMGATLEDVYEPYLLQRGLITRTPQGRQAMPAAFEHMGLPLPRQE